MKVAILGAGNVASHMARALSGVGHDVALWNRSEAALVPLRVELNVSCTTDLAALPSDADVYLISVKDDAVAAVAQQLAEVGCTAAVYAHTAGSLPKSLLEPYFKHSGVLYPMQTFSKGKALDYSKIPFFVEEENNILHELALTISERVYTLSSEQRKVLHTASVFACNFANHCCTIASELLRDIGVPFSALLPLVDETVAKLSVLPPNEAQTGPAIREDYGVIDAQISLLDAYPDWREIYTRLTSSIITHKHNHDRLRPKEN